MLFKISFLTSLLFAAIYPLCFWISAKDPLKNNFHRFHLGLPCLVAGLTAILYWFNPSAAVEFKNFLIVWTITLLIVSGLYWNKASVNPLVILVPCLGGIFISLQFASLYVPLSDMAALLLILGGMIFCASLFAMNLGHWYLNVHGLPIKHLINATYVFWALCAIRAICDVYLMFTQKIMFRGEPMMLYQFVGTVEGFLLILAILFGTIFPLICLYFVKGTLDVKSTQSATGILYAILCGVVIGDITYKYYFFKYGVIL